MSSSATDSSEWRSGADRGGPPQIERYIGGACTIDFEALLAEYELRNDRFSLDMKELDIVEMLP